MAQVKQGEFGRHPMGQYRAEPAREGVETMHPAPHIADEDMVRSARIDEGADADRNDRRAKVAWSAGFVDGEGCVYIHGGVKKNGSVYYQVKLVVTQKQREPLDILASLYGGSVAKRGSADGRFSWHQWTIVANMCLSALKEMVEYMVVKKEQAEIAIDFQARLMFRRGRTPLTSIEIKEREQIRLKLKAMHD